MNYRNQKYFAAAVVLLGALSSHPLAYAQEGHDHAAKPAAADAAPAADAKVQIPATVEAIWSAIDQKRAELAKLIQSGSLGESAI